MVGQAPLKTTIFERERLRCNACGQIFTAAEPATAGPDKTDATAVAMIALLKYGTGVPFQRLERLEGQLAIPLPAATQWDLMAAAAKLLWAVLQESSARQRKAGCSTMTTQACGFCDCHASRAT